MRRGLSEWRVGKGESELVAKLGGAGDRKPASTAPALLDVPVIETHSLVQVAGLGEHVLAAQEKASVLSRRAEGERERRLRPFLRAFKSERDPGSREGLTPGQAAHHDRLGNPHRLRLYQLRAGRGSTGANSGPGKYTAGAAVC